MISSSCLIASCIKEVVEEEVMLRTRSFCRVSSVEICEEGILGCEGKDASIIERSFERDIDEGRVSGSKRAFRIRVSFAERDVLGRETAAIVE